MKGLKKVKADLVTSHGRVVTPTSIAPTHAEEYGDSSGNGSLSDGSILM